MGKIVAKKEMVLIVEMVIQPAGGLIPPRVVRNDSAIVFKLIDDEAAERIGSRIQGQSSVKDCGTSGRGQIRSRVGRGQAQVFCNGGTYWPTQTGHGT